MTKKFTSIGGQAVIEGVMMRSPGFIAVAVRRPDKKIVIKGKPFKGIASKYPILAKPLLRGVVSLVESMGQGIQALGYSAEVAGVEEDANASSDSKMTTLAIAGSMIAAFFMAMALFVALPHFATLLVTDDMTSPEFHLIDGTVKLFVLLGYVSLIGMMKDIKRVFQYHGAEHKSIYAFESGEELTVENARKQSTLHPRCGTSFLLFLVLISVVVFSIVFPLLGLPKFSEYRILNQLVMVCIKMGLMFPVAGLSYEFIKFSACHMDKPIFRAFAWPGMMLQKLTTREPDDDQLEIALASLKYVLAAEKAPATDSFRTAREITIQAPSELMPVAASVSEFAEA